MGEKIELHTFTTKSALDIEDDIEEYHEIYQSNVPNVHDNMSSEQLSPIKEYDFFTNCNVKVKSHKKENAKKKKSRKGKMEGEPTLFDIIQTELATKAAPITKNIITQTNVEENNRNYSYLIRIPSVKSVFRKSRPFRYDSEFGMGVRHNSVTLSPLFPRILENAVPEKHTIPTQYVDPITFKDIALDQERKGDEKFLCITLSSIKFTYHHLFSLENMLCTKLISIYNEFQDVKEKLGDISRNLRVNRETRDNLKFEFAKISPKSKDEVRFDPTVRKYTAKLIELKEQYHNVQKRQMKLLHKMVSLWSDIEMIRDKSGNIETPYNLYVIKKDLDQENTEREWDYLFNIEFNDMLDTIEFEFVTKYIEYKEHQKKSDTKHLNKPKLIIDEAALKEEVEQIVNKVISSQNNEVILKKDQITSVKASLFYKNTYQFEIYVDDVFVCSSEKYTFSKEYDVCVEFSESFSVQILTNNEILTIVLLENDKNVSFMNVTLNDIRQNDKTAEYSLQKFIYKDMTLQPNQNNVGCGYSIKEIAKAKKVRLKSSNIFEGVLQTECDVRLKFGWIENVVQNQNEMIKYSINIGSRVKRLMHGIEKANIESIADIIEKIYGTDVIKNDDIIHHLQQICKGTIKNNFEFPMDENGSEFIRLKLLHLRNIGGFTSIENKLVPIHASQISTEHLSCLQKSTEKGINVEYISEKYGQADPIELQRFVGSKYIQKLNENMLKNLHDHLMKKTHKDVVRDYQSLSIRSFFTNKPSLGTISTMPRITRQQYMKSALGQEQEVQVTVLRAFNLMDRSSSFLSDDNEDDDCNIAGFKVRPLRPFVRLSYKGLSTHTATAIGCHPTWNQTIKIRTKLQPLSSLHINLFDEYKVMLNEGSDEDVRGKTVRYRYCNRWLGTVQVPLYTVLTLGELHGTFKISTPPLLFGYEIVQNKDTAQSLIPQVVQLLRKETSFISLHITTSLSHFGGLHGYNQPISSTADDNILIKHLNTTVTNYINDFPSRNISLTFIDSSGMNKCVTQFLQPISLPNYECFPRNPMSSRAESALSKSSGFSKSSSSKSSGGRRRDEERISQGDESLYSAREGSTRGESQVVKMMNAALRYVSLIPTYDVTETHVVTLMGVELLKVLIGSPLDHTILLASYFLQLGIKCWVVMGQGLPRGQSSFVLTKYDQRTRRDLLVTDQWIRGTSFSSKGDGFLWHVHDATTGESSELRDVSCPLKTVDFVFDTDNIWLNVQSTQECEGMSFDFTKSSSWLPVFDRTIFVMKNSLVAESGLYSAPADVTSLRDSLEAKIKLKVQKWRPQLKTIWNRYCSSLLREVLPLWEYWTYNPAEQKPGFSQRLKQLMITYKLFGFPLNMAFTSTKSVVSTVKATGLHLNDDPTVEYALAVDVYAYPNNVLSVWVFLASIARI